MLTVTALQLVNMLLAGAQALEEHQREINELNVFPVPDGDTGTNMVLTAHGMVQALARLDLDKERQIGEAAQTAAEASLLAARGNSGVIFSQFVRGLARALKGKNVASPVDVARAFQYGLVYAYQAVAHPVEGTMLTVAREAARSARELVRSSSGLHDLLTSAIAGGNEALARTPEQLPALKQAGVVDAGGYGLLLFLQGCLRGLTGETVTLPMPEKAVPAHVPPAAEACALAYTYCTEVLVRGRGVNIQEVRAHLEALGDSLVLVPGTDLLKVHIHTNHPGLVLETFTGLGTLHQVKIDNMAEQHRESDWTTKQGLLVVAVAPGEGLARIFQHLGADRVIPGGETMNPSVQDFLQAMQGARHVLVLPNSNNIQLAAEQAAELTGQAVQVVPTADALQGLAALLAFDRNAGMEQNMDRMLAAIGSVRTARITYAARDSAWDNERIGAGSILGLTAGRLLAKGEDLVAVTCQVVAGLLKEAGQAELLTLFRGSRVGPGEAADLVEALAAALPELEIELKDGDQPNDYFLLMLE